MLRSVLAPIHPDGWRFIAIFAVASVVLFFLWAPLGWLGPAYLALIAVTNLVVVYLVARLMKSPTPREGKKRTRQLYLTLLLFVVAFIAVRLLSV